MKTRLKLLSPLAVLAMVFGCSAVWAAGDVHEHGAADLLLSSEGKDVQITFNAPAQSLVGFETAAVTTQQKTAVERLEAVLSEPSALFVLEGTFCELIDAVVDVSSITGVVDAPSPPREHGDHAEERAAHKGEHAEHADEHAEHASVTISTTTKITRIGQITTSTNTIITTMAATHPTLTLIVMFLLLTPSNATAKMR